MQKTVRNHMKKIMRENKNRKKLYAILAVCAVFVAGIVTWQLMMPGEAWTGEAKCGKEEHTHIEACYENALICGHEESEGHTHTDACYTEEQHLVCGQEEDENHSHGEECYQTEHVLTCGHEESEGHTHGDGCYEQQLTCHEEEHTHEASCYSDAEADVETEAEWKESFTHVELTDDWNQNVAMIARSQVGYKESERNFTVVDEDTIKGYSRYGAWSGDTYGDWGTLFAAFCLHYAEVPSDAFPVDYDIQKWVDALNEAGYYASPTDTQPEVGNLVIMNKQDRETATQIGIISGIDEQDGVAQNIYVIEGNCDNEVKENKYAANDAEIIGYGMLSSAEDTYKGTETKDPEGTEEVKKTTPEDQSKETPKTNGVLRSGQNQISETIDQKVTLSVTAKDLGNGIEAGTGVNGQILYASVDVTNSNPTDVDPSTARVYIGELPDGVSLAGFIDGVMEVGYKSGTTNESFQVHLITKADGSPDYIQFVPPTGITVHFELQFNSENGIMDKESKVTLTPEIVDAAANDVVSEPAELKWSGVNVWRNLKKTADQTVLNVNGKENSLTGKINYVITAEQMNAAGANDVGAIWTKEVKLKDTLTLPDGIDFPKDAKVSADDKTIVTGSGEEIFGFKKLQGGTITSLTLEGKVITYEVTVPNQYLKNEVPTKEQDHLKVELALDVSKLKLRDNYAETSTDEQIAADKIINQVDIETIAYKGSDTYIDHKEVETKLQVDKGFTISKSANKTYVKPGETIEYTISIKNTGDVPLKEKDENGQINYVTDKLPKYLVLTQAQIEALKVKGAFYNSDTHTIQWNPGTIAAGETRELKFAITVADAETMKDVFDWYGITNTASYQGKQVLTTITYRKPSITIRKSHEGGGQTVQNGDLVTYVVTVENPEDFESYAQTIKDKLPNGLEFQHMLDSSRKEVTEPGMFKTVSTATGKTHDVNFELDGQNLTWELGKLAAKEKVTLTYVCKVNTDKLDGSQTALKNIVTTEPSGGGSASDEVGVGYPLDIDKSLVNGKEGETYEDGKELEYKISIQNAKGDAASKRDDLKLVDTLPYGMLPSGYDLYTKKQGVNEVLSTDDLEKMELTWEDYVADTKTLEQYYTIINNEIVEVTKSGTSNTTRGVILTWNIGSMKPGEKIEKTYKVKISLSESDKESGTKVTYTNTATIGGRSDSVTIYGKEEVGSLRIQKRIRGEVQIGDLTDAQKAKIQFEVTLVDKKTGEIILNGSNEPEYQRTLTLNDFTLDSGVPVWNLNNLKYGSYKVEEVKTGDFPEYNTTVTVNGAKKKSVIVELSKANSSSNVAFVNEYSIPGNAKVDIQKSVWSITEQRAKTESSKLKDKEIFPKSTYKKDQDMGNFVIYNIIITNTGSEAVHLTKMIDHMTNGLEYRGIRTDLNNPVALHFKDTAITNQWDTSWAGINSDRSQGNVRIEKTSLDAKKQTVTFQIGGTNGHSLQPNKSLSFFMICRVRDDAALDVPLTNTVDLIVDSEVLHGKDPNTVTMKNTRDDTQQNYGTGVDMGVDEETGKRTISAAVTVTPTDVIVPGITKEAELYIPAGRTVDNRVTIKEKDNIQPNVTVKWNVTLYNDGTVPIKGYNIKDSIMKPFHIVSAQEAETLGFANGKNVFVLTVNDANNQFITEKDLSQEVWEAIEESGSSEFTISIKDSKYAIPAGGNAVLTVYTKNDTFENKIYENTATFMPQDKFDANRVRRGQLVTDENDAYIGVKASDSVYALGDYGSFSWKTIEDAADSSNKGWGYRGQENQNYITLDGDRRTVIYTNNVENVSKNPFKNMVVVDLMPYEGDHGVINSTEKRDSQFSVAFGALDSLRVYVTDDKNNLQRELVQGEGYTIEFSALDMFTDADVDGKASNQWHTQWQQGDKSFRIKMAQDFELAPGEILVMQYMGEIGDDANPGEIAWNSFGYRYTATHGGRETTLTAEPPKVGVRIRKESTIEKQVVDESGQSLGYDATKSFTFKLYEGDTPDEANYVTEFTLHQGEAISLDKIRKADGSAAFKDAKQYTVVEVKRDGFELVGMGIKGQNLSPDNSFTFTYYHNTDSISIVVKNKELGYVLPSTGGIGTIGYTISGAILMLIACLLYGYRLRCKRERRVRYRHRP